MDERTNALTTRTTLTASDVEITAANRSTAHSIVHDKDGRNSVRRQIQDSDPNDPII